MSGRSSKKVLRALLIGLTLLTFALAMTFASSSREYLLVLSVLSREGDHSPSGLNRDDVDANPAYGASRGRRPVSFNQLLGLAHDVVRKRLL